MREKENSNSNFEKLLRKSAGAGSGSIRQTRMEPYDFKQSEKFTSDQQKFLHGIFTRFAESVITTLAPILQSRVQLDLVSIKLKSYRSFLQTLPDPSTLIVFRVDSETKGMLVLSHSLSSALVDRLMGGKGQPFDENRYFTEIESAVLKKTVDRFMECYHDAWQQVKDIKPQYVEMSFNPLGVHIASPSEVMVSASFNTKLALAHGTMEVCLPFRHLKNVVPRASFDEFMLSRTTQVPASQSITPLFAKNLEGAKVPISVELGDAEIFFQDLLNLEAGDYIKLEAETTSLMKIKVNGKSKFLGRPGVRSGRMAVQISKVLAEGDEEFEE
ncbi:MAG: FliM/FliN family flagellar motor switch protein [Firmicutes bacterium]|nr:FliM/FliN family flagellar motor switch protein [Bacillota bacterium]